MKKKPERFQQKEAPEGAHGEDTEDIDRINLATRDIDDHPVGDRIGEGIEGTEDIDRINQTSRT